MFNMGIPWWEFIIRALVVYLFLLATLKLTGKRQIGQLAPFDLVLLLILSNAVQNSMNGGDNSLVGGLILASTLLAVNWVFAYLSFKYRDVEKLIDGKPEVLVWDGQVFPKTMLQEKITHQELEGAIRKAGGEGLKSVHFAILECNGGISIKFRDEHLKDDKKK